MRARIPSIVAICGLVAASIVGIAVPSTAAGLSAKDLLQQLTVGPETSAASYDRALFQHWIDADGDGCDTRSEVLQAESTTAVTFSSGCTVATGQWNSWYDGGRWTNASDVDIDHLVPLKESWDSGANRWTAETRGRYANDLADARALVAVTDNVNQSKSDRDPAEWLPTYGKCRYVRQWTAVKVRWGLTVNRAEKKKLVNLASGCANVVLKVTKAKVVTAGTSGSGSTGGDGALDPRFDYCYQATAAGYGPYYQGKDTEYGWYTDGDGDGVVCE